MVLPGCEMNGGGRGVSRSGNEGEGLAWRGCAVVIGSGRGEGDGKGRGSSKEVGTIPRASLPVAPTRSLILQSSRSNMTWSKESVVSVV